MKNFCGKVLVASLLLLAAGAVQAMLGGFGVSTYLPKPGDPRTKGALLMVQPIGCHGPGSAVTARAEGLVNGVRRSIPLKLIPVPMEQDSDQPDAYMLKREWPSDGTWVLAITAKKDSMRADTLVRLDAHGNVLMVDRPSSRSWDSARVLPDGKTKLLPWTFRDDARVVAMNIVAGNLATAVDYTLRSPARR